MPGSLGTPRYKELIALLIKARKKACLTQADVARQLNKPQSFVAKYEGGERRLDVIELIDIAAILGVKTDNILRELEAR